MKTQLILVEVDLRRRRFLFSALHTGRPDIESRSVLSPSADASAPPSTVPSLVEGTLCTNRHRSINSVQKVKRNFFFFVAVGCVPG